MGGNMKRKNARATGGNMKRKNARVIKGNTKRKNARNKPTMKAGSKPIPKDAPNKPARELDFEYILEEQRKQERRRRVSAQFEHEMARALANQCTPELESAPVDDAVKVNLDRGRQESHNPQGVKVGAGKPRITRIPTSRLPEEPARPPLVIGFASEPGGVGCTTLAAHLAYYLAAFKKKNTLACSQDGGLLRFLIPDARLSVDTHWIVAGTSRLAVTYAASIAWDARTRFTDLGLPFHPDVIVQDRTLLCMKKPDVVIVPVSDSRSERALSEGRFSRGAVATILLGNQNNRESGALLLRLQYGGLKESPGIYFVQNAIPDSGLLRRSAELGQTVWELAPKSYTADCMRAAFGEIGQLITTASQQEMVRRNV